MLSTARQRLPRLAALQPAFAESSRQAELRSRATAAPEACCRKLPAPRAFAAAALASAVSSDADEATPSFYPATTVTSHGTATKPPRPPPLHEDKLTPGERFRRRVQQDPVGALLSLPSLNSASLSTIVPKDILTMLYHITKEIKPSPQLRASIPQEQAEEALNVVRALLHVRPSSEASPHRDTGFGRTLSGKTLRALLRTGLLLGAREFVFDLFSERMDEQAHSGRSVVDTTGFAVDLAAAREWRLATQLFDGPNDLVPREVFTPRVISILMTAHLTVHQPWEAARLFKLLDLTDCDARMTTEARCGLVRAHLQLGDIAAAQAAVHAANAAGIDNAAIQLAMLRGYRMLGYNADVEARVRQDLQRLALAPLPSILNAFIWLRLDAGDLEGAERILRELETVMSTDSVEFDPQTTLVAISIASRRGDITSVQRVWHWLVSHPELITDETVAHLCRALGRLGHADDAVTIFRSSIHNHTSPWPLPPSFRSDILTANAVLDVATRAHQYDGLLEVATLMREANIKPDERTLIQVLEFASRTLVTNPASLAQLLRDLLSRTASSPTVDQLSVVIGETIRVALRDASSAQRYLAPSHGQATETTAGIQTRGAIRHLLSSQLASLRASGQKSTASSLSNRLLYDALALDGVWPAPAIQKTWQSFVLRGFRPSVKHYRSLVAAYAKIGALREAEDVIALATAGSAEGGGAVGPEAERDMWTAVLVGWAQAGDLASARRAYERIRAGPALDACALEAIVYAHVAGDEPERAVRIASRDVGAVDMDERTVATVAHALRRAGDMAGCVFFLAHYAAKDGSGWVLSRRMLAPLRKALNYMRRSRQMDDRTREAVLLAERMMADDAAARPRHARRQPALTPRTRQGIAQLFDRAEIARRTDSAWREIRDKDQEHEH